MEVGERDGEVDVGGWVGEGSWDWRGSGAILIGGIWVKHIGGGLEIGEGGGRRKEN